MHSQKHSTASNRPDYTYYLSYNMHDKIERPAYNYSAMKKGDTTMSITATELKSNLGKYLLLSATEDIYITRNGKVVAKLTNPFQERIDIAKSLFGVISSEVTLEMSKEQRLNRI